jgi:glycosyltransferase involved in cell wall biosynthesis
MRTAMQHPEAGQKIDMSGETNKYADISDSSVTIYAVNGYGSPEIVRQLMEMEKPDVLFFFTDPRYWIWLFSMENEIRQHIPMVYLNIWDDLPAPLYNKPYYESCDALMAISKQTLNINKIVLGEEVKNKILKYVPHGINEKFFYPINQSHPQYNDLLEFKKILLKEKEYKFVLLYNARNIRRKSVPDLLAAYKLFCESIGEEKAKECVLILHTQKVDDNGTDLPAVIELLDTPGMNVEFSEARLDVGGMNLLYNSCDGVILLSSNEGWGLSITEGMMCGKMIIANVTGGMQDQMKFLDEEGKWINFDSEFCSNHFGKYQNHGEWALPIFPSNMSLVGSPLTPYIWDDRCDFREAAKVIEKLYNLSPEERKSRGLKGREWVQSDESNMSTRKMNENVIEVLDTTMQKFQPRKHFEFIKIKDYPKKKLAHKLIY